jgi:hypothetical protein
MQAELSSAPTPVPAKLERAPPEKTRPLIHFWISPRRISFFVEKAGFLLSGRLPKMAEASGLRSGGMAAAATRPHTMGLISTLVVSLVL